LPAPSAAGATPAYAMASLVPCASTTLAETEAAVDASVYRRGPSKRSAGAVSSVRHLYPQGGLAMSWKGAVCDVRRSDRPHAPLPWIYRVVLVV
jgi:hypothetical protein